MTKIFSYLSFLSLLGAIFNPVFASPLLAGELRLSKGQLLAQSLPNSFEDYQKSCLQRVNRRGLRGEAAQAICNCAINRFRGRYSIAQFRDLVQKAKTNQAAARALSDVGEACFEQVLYED